MSLAGEGVAAATTCVKANVICSASFTCMAGAPTGAGAGALRDFTSVWVLFCKVSNLPTLADSLSISAKRFPMSCAFCLLSFMSEVMAMFNSLYIFITSCWVPLVGMSMVSIVLGLTDFSSDKAGAGDGAAAAASTGETVAAAGASSS